MEAAANQKIAGETVVVPEGARSALAGSFTLNRIAAVVWELMGESRPINEIARVVAGEFGLGFDAALAQTQQIIDSFQAGGAVASPRPR